MGWGGQVERLYATHRSISAPARNLLEIGGPHGLNLKAQRAPMPAGSASSMLVLVSPPRFSPLHLGHRRPPRPNRKAGLHICSDNLLRMSATYAPATTEPLMGKTRLGLFKYF